MKRPEELLALPNFGTKTLETIFEALEKFGFVRKGKTNGTVHEAANIEARRNKIRDALGGTAADDWDAEVVYAKARARKRKSRKPKRGASSDSEGESK